MNKALGKAFLEYKLLLVMGGIVILMFFFDFTFFNPINLINIISHVSINGILAMGMTLLMISRSFDMSIGSIMVLSGTITVMLVRVIGIPGAILVGVLSGILMGWLNGILVAKFKINSFIATLGTMVIFQGMAFSLTNMKPISSRNPNFQIFATYELFEGVPIVILYFLIAIFIVWFISRFTRLGKNAYDIGGNMDACRMMGINVDYYSIVFFIISGVFASFGGVLLSSKIDAASAVFGENVGLQIIAGIVIGGVSLAGGVGKVMGVVQGIILLGLLENVTMYLGLFGYFQLLFRALILLGVVIFDIVYVNVNSKMLEKTNFRKMKEIG
ncbi:MAG: ABC transporter permease [Candidatus Atribacteria bacterium]|nr:ABC transporter permease [Candidatus Atribacteria bacterium]